MGDLVMNRRIPVSGEDTRPEKESNQADRTPGVQHMDTADAPPIQKMNFESVRLATFENRWQAQPKVDMVKLARAGFYYEGNGTDVVCFSCNIHLSDWNYGDVAMRRHTQASPACLFVNNKSDNIPVIVPATNHEPANNPQPRTQPQTNQSQHQFPGPPQQNAGPSEAAVSSTFSSAMAANSKTWSNFECLNLEAERLKTFKGWPVTFLDPADLARSGFYYLRERDKVQCVFCMGIVGEWDEGDVPASEHQRHFPSCPFMCGYNVGNIAIRPEEDPSRLGPAAPYDTVARYQYEMQMYSQYERETGTGGRPGPRGGVSNSLTINGSKDVLTRQQMDELGVIPHEGPEYARYATVDSRIKSYARWPHDIPQDITKLVDAGFFYAGLSDHVKCFYCGGGLRNWEAQDDPWEEHARWFSQCVFVVLTKGTDYIRGVCEKNPPIVSAGSVPSLPSKSAFYPNADGSLSNAVYTNRDSIGCLNGNVIHNPGSHWTMVPSSRRFLPEEVDHFMQSDIVQMALNTGLPRDSIRGALELRLNETGIPFLTADSLVNATVCLIEAQSTFVSAGPATPARAPIDIAGPRHPNGIAHHHDDDEEIYSPNSTPSSSPPMISNLTINGHAENYQPRITKPGAKSDDSHVVLEIREEASAQCAEGADAESGDEKMDESAPSSLEGAASSLEPPGDTIITGGASNKQMKEVNACKICMDEVVGVVFLPCGHLVSCVSCAPALKTCPVCRTRIRGTVRTYLS